ALDERAADPAADALIRIGTPLAKYWICKRGPGFAFEAMEVLGGNGYTEEAPLARLYRELPVNSIWEGSGNVMCLDVLRALGRHPECHDALAAELAAARGADRRYDAFVARLLRELTPAALDEAQGRRITEDLARAWQAALLQRGAPSAVADAFCAARLDAEAGGRLTFGALPAGVDMQAIVDRAMPAS
ncbi:MAG: acyl-CoA dehydrogenase family protein, partial [Burkholderiaceae bacterium]